MTDRINYYPTYHATPLSPAERRVADSARLTALEQHRADVWRRTKRLRGLRRPRQMDGWPLDAGWME